MAHPHVRVYTNDHADAADLAHDYPCLDIDEARQRLVELVQEYTDRAGGQEAMGEVVDFEDADAITLWPQDAAQRPVHLSIHFCEQQHDVEK